MFNSKNKQIFVDTLWQKKKKNTKSNRAKWKEMQKKPIHKNSIHFEPQAEVFSYSQKNWGDVCQENTHSVLFFFLLLVEQLLVQTPENVQPKILFALSVWHRDHPYTIHNFAYLHDIPAL